MPSSKVETVTLSLFLSSKEIDDLVTLAKKHGGAVLTLSVRMEMNGVKVTGGTATEPPKTSAPSSDSEHIKAEGLAILNHAKALMADPKVVEAKRRAKAKRKT